MIFSIFLGAQKNCLIETVLLSTHNICFGWEIRKLFFWYALLTKGLDKAIFIREQIQCNLKFLDTFQTWPTFQFYSNLNSTVNKQQISLLKLDPYNWIETCPSRVNK